MPSSSDIPAAVLTQHRSQMSAESAQIDDAFSKLYRCSPVKDRGEPRYPLHRFAWKNRRSRRSHRRHCNRRRHNHNQSHAVIVAIVIAIVVIIVAMHHRNRHIVVVVIAAVLVVVAIAIAMQMVLYMKKWVLCKRGVVHGYI